MADQGRTGAQGRTDADAARAQTTPRGIADYLQAVEPVKRTELERIRTLAKTIVPSAEEAIMYGMPTFKYQGKPFLGLAAHKHHIGIYPYSGEVIEKLKDLLHEYGLSKGAVRVPVDQPVPESILRSIIECRLEQIRAAS
jgi:uncharacterized protein YdhG (YjbR/CyaY superfamily)